MWRASRSATLLAFVLRDPCLHEFLDERSRQGLVRGELNGPFGGGEVLEFVLERFENRGGGEQTAVVRKGGEPHQYSFVLDCGNPVADGLGSLGWHGRPNRRAKLFQHAAGGFGHTSEVFINVLVFRSPATLGR